MGQDKKNPKNKEKFWVALIQKAWLNFKKKKLKAKLKKQMKNNPVINENLPPVPEKT